MIGDIEISMKSASLATFLVYVNTALDFYLLLVELCFLKLLTLVGL